MDTFFVNSLWTKHTLNGKNKQNIYIVDGKTKIRICDAKNLKIRQSNDTYYAQYNIEKGNQNKIPLWLFGFLY